MSDDSTGPPKTSPQLPATWTNDCQGKQDFDSELVTLSTRYWPRGGGFDIFDSTHPELGLQGNKTRPEHRPSAHASIILPQRGEGGMGPILAEMRVEADTEAEVKTAVEEWAREKYAVIVRVLGAAL